VSTSRSSSGTPEARACVVIPTYNDGELVAEAVASVREDEPVEIVVVDDGTSDPASLDVLARLEASGTHVVHRPNGGPSAARWTGVQATTAPYVLPLDGDDRLTCGALGRAVDLLERHPQAGFLWGDYLAFGDKDEHHRAPERFLPWSTTYLNLLVPTLLFRREVVQETGGWPPILYEDWAIQLALMECDITGVRYDGILFERRVHGGGRALVGARRRHAVLYADLKRRYPEAFSRRPEWRRIEQPSLWKRLLYPVLFGSRRFVPIRLETMLRGSQLWTKLRPLRR